MENVTLKTKSTDWKDKAAGWHTWRGVNTCPVCGVKFNDAVSGTREQADRFVGECPKCDEMEG